MLGNIGMDAVVNMMAVWQGLAVALLVESTPTLLDSDLPEQMSKFQWELVPIDVHLVARRGVAWRLCRDDARAPCRAGHGKWHLIQNWMDWCCPQTLARINKNNSVDDFARECNKVWRIFYLPKGIGYIVITNINP